jgi:integrase/recombinase XerD
MHEKIITEINKLLKKDKLNRKQIYENLLAKGVVKPNTEKIVYETLEYALEGGLISPSRVITYRKKKGKLPELFTTEQLIKLFDNVNRPKLAVTMWLGFFCGLRIREICNLQIDDIDLQNKRIFIRNSKNTNRSKQGYGKDRIVTIPDLAISPIKKWLEIVQGGKWFLPSMTDPDRAIRTKTIHEQYRELLQSCGLSIGEYTTHFKQKNHGRKKEMSKTTYKYRFHTLRHTFASYLLDKGVPLENIQRQLGHEQIDTTLIYAKVSDKKTKQLINEAFNMPMALVNRQSLPITPIDEKRATREPNLSPETILKQRLARGEIDLVTFKRLLAELQPENTVNIIHTVK